ncbi:MAG TPA: glycosyltransferase family 1 protein [Desulfurivibrio alkaliphilus]|uniref:Glycosyltransferase family 1 protein n=1 Tax=Desulfurivibrio alkaliphilus TaxID=427923 RepID=A0A7C2XNI2_9BACT|nr:glycosyltransferase family 1 protein [Desulfurivibrio alkaliphilus]
MRIAIISDAWHPQVNGVVTTLTRTIAQLESWRHRVFAVTPNLFQTLPCPGYPEIPLALLPYRKMVRVLDNFRPEAIHIATEGPLGWAARRYCRRRKLGFTTSYHTRFPEYIRLRLPIPTSWSYGVMRRFHGPAAATMVAGAPLAAELAGYGFGPLKIWSRGVDTELFRPRDKEFLAAPRPVYLYAGRVAVEKNIEDFLRLKLPGSKYVIGDGPALARLRREYPEVVFPGYKKGEELAAHLAAADVFVFPSRTDTFGLVMLEAMACGVPVAAYPVPGPAGLVVNGENGYLNRDLARAADAALGVSPESCRKFAGQFSWHSCTRQFLDNLHRLPSGA